MSIEGTLADFRLPEILQAVAQQRRTGILTVQSETTIVAVSFLSGGVVSADSLAHTLEERLGEALVADGRLDRATLADLVRRQDAGEGRLVDLLVSSGQLTRAEVLDAVRRQNERLLVELLDWREGEFKFYGGDEVAYEEGIAPISVEDLLLSTLGRDGDEGGLAGESALAWGETAEGPDLELAAAAPAASDEPLGLTTPFGEPPPRPPDAPAVPPWPVEPAPIAPAAPRTAVTPAERAGKPPVAEPVRRRSAAAPAAAPAAERSARSLPAALGLLLAALLVVAAVAVPSRLLVPFPWQDADRAALAEVQRLADRLAVDRAAKTVFLLEGRFPESLDRLVALGLLDREDRVGPDGDRLTLVAREESYDVVAEGDEEPLWSEAISGNFLLDPELRDPRPAATGDEAPLVLLD